MPDTAPDRATNLIWIDLEMTGLCTQTDTIIEIATIVTDKYLTELAEGPVLAIRQPAETMEGMDEWNTRQHGKSGLTARVLASNTSLVDAEQATIDFLKEWVDEGASHARTWLRQPAGVHRTRGCAGIILVNVMSEELPRGREGHLRYFLVGGLVFAVMSVLIPRT